MNTTILIVSIIALSLVGCLSIYTLGDVSAQNTNATQTTKWNEFFTTSNEFETEFGSDSVEVVYESDKTVALKSGYIDTIWAAVDYLKADGFRIDDIVSYETTIGFTDPSIRINFLVVLSKP